jgi:hypothetical protein
MLSTLDDNKRTNQKINRFKRIIKNVNGRPVGNIERTTNCIIRLLLAVLVFIIITVASFSLLSGQPFVNGLSLLVTAITLSAMAMGYRKVELIWKAIRIRLKR